MLVGKMNLLFHQSLSAPNGFPELVSFDLGSSRFAVTTWSTAEGKAALTGRITSGPYAPSFPRTAASSPTDVAVTEHLAHGDQTTILRAVSTSFIHTQPLRDGFLVVGSRCRWTPKHVDKNALRFDREGRLVQEATFGDGIESIAATANGLTWVGYFDEGVFGNFGWGTPGPQPVGCHGINCFNAELQLVAHAPDKFEIVDCYAMNVMSESVYACCYSDWRIRRIDPSGAQTTWTNEVTGATNLLVSGDMVALVGGYKERDRVVVGILEEGSFRIVSSGNASLNRARLPSSARLVARGHELHALVDHDWYRCELRRQPI
jgi:hypothetical protein